MDLNTFLDHFDTIAEAPGGIAKLRALILNLAVRGKLVPKKLDDEPASVLIDKINFEKERLVKGKKIRKADPLPPIELDELPYELPDGWEWVRFGSATICRDGERIPLAKEERATRQGKYDYYGASGIIDKIDDYLFDKPLLLIGEDGANLVNRSTPIAFIASGKYWVNNHAHVLDGLSLDCLRYFEVFINAIDLKPYVTGTAQPKMNQAKMNSIPVPLPLLTEQKRIVEKVDELMALCDRLAAAKQTRDDLRQKLRGSAIAALTNAETDEGLGESWAIVRDNWHTLSQDPKDVDDLRRSILQLAVQGKLIHQNLGDESVLTVLNRIKTKESKNRKTIETQTTPFDIPQTWQWVHLGDVANHCLGKMLDKQKNKGIPLPYLRNLNVRWFSFDLTDVLEMPFEEHEHERFDVLVGDVLICEGGEPGRAAVWEGQIPTVKFQKAIHRVRPTEALYNRFFVYCLLVDSKSRRLEKYFTGATFKHFTGQELGRYLIPLPPLAEQKRIVAKVDELMQICDQLEVSLRQSQQRASALAASAISHLTI